VTLKPAKYVYGIVAEGAALPAGGGIDGAPLELVAAGGIAAIVTDVLPSRLKLGRDAMSAHARVVRDAHQLGTILPMRFGVMLAGATAVRTELLDPHHAELLAQLAEFEGKVELKLRAVYDEDQILREVVREDQDVARLRASLRGAPEDATYYGRIELGQLIAEAIDRRREVDAGDILEALAPLALAVELGEATTEHMVLNASFLVARDAMGVFDTAVDRIGQARSDSMRFRYTGPLPPHSFVQLATAA
jgi:hypothetical protein